MEYSLAFFGALIGPTIYSAPETNAAEEMKDDFTAAFCIWPRETPEFEQYGQYEQYEQWENVG